jgi:ribosomal protein S18 acetylase RimI-like enzyme
MIDDWDDWFDHLDDRSDLEIRPMCEADLDEVLRFIRLHDTDDWEAARRGFEQTDLGHPWERMLHLVAVDEDDDGDVRPVGVSGYYIDDFEARGVYWLSWTYVNPFFQGEGVGTQLMNAVVETLEVLGARRLFVSTSSLDKYGAAVEFYERHGFEREGRLEDYYAPGEDQLILGRPLA